MTATPIDAIAADEVEPSTRAIVTNDRAPHVPDVVSITPTGEAGVDTLTGDEPASVGVERSYDAVPLDAQMGAYGLVDPAGYGAKQLPKDKADVHRWDVSWQIVSVAFIAISGAGVVLVRMDNYDGPVGERIAITVAALLVIVSSLGMIRLQAWARRAVLAVCATLMVTAFVIIVLIGAGAIPDATDNTAQQVTWDSVSESISGLQLEALGAGLIAGVVARYLMRADVSGKFN